MKYKTGWKPDIPDKRDFYLVKQIPSIRKAPKAANIDLRKKCPPVLDQGELGSCVGCAWSFAVQFEESLKTPGKFTNVPSRLFIYYNTREMEGTVDTDAGCTIRNAIKTISKQGVCYENIWAYNINRFAKRPIKQCYREASTNKALTYYRLNQTKNELINCLSSGFPFVFGIAIYESFYDSAVDKTGIVQMPSLQEGFLGGHAIAAVGYIPSSDRIIFRNSWSDQWGDRGYGTIPMRYILDGDLAADFWTLRKTS